MVPTIGVSPYNFAHAIKPLDVETCNGPERGISPCDAFFIWEAFSGLPLDDFCVVTYIGVQMGLS